MAPPARHGAWHTEGFQKHGGVRQASPALQPCPPSAGRRHRAPPSRNTARCVRGQMGAREAHKAAQSAHRGSLWALAGPRFSYGSRSQAPSQEGPEAQGHRSCGTSLCRGRRCGLRIGLSCSWSHTAQPRVHSLTQAAPPPASAYTARQPRASPRTTVWVLSSSIPKKHCLPGA